MPSVEQSSTTIISKFFNLSSKILLIIILIVSISLKHGITIDILEFDILVVVYPRFFLVGNDSELLLLIVLSGTLCSDVTLIVFSDEVLTGSFKSNVSSSFSSFSFEISISLKSETELLGFLLKLKVGDLLKENLGEDSFLIGLLRLTLSYSYT